MRSRFRSAALAALAALLAGAAGAHDVRVRAQELATLACSDGLPSSVWVINSSDSATCSATSTGTAEAECCCANGAWAACGGSGGGSGDVEAVWGCTSGDCSTLTAASGDSLDAGSADDSSPATRSTSLPGTCSEGQLHQDTDSGGSETYVCTAANTWTKLSTTETVETDDVAPYGQYDPNNPPATCFACEEWTDNTASQTWRWANQNGAAETISFDGVLLTGDDPTNQLMVRFMDAATNSDQTLTARIDRIYTGSAINFSACGVIVLHGGTEASPTDVNYLMMGNFSTDGIYHQVDSDYDPTSGATAVGDAWSLEGQYSLSFYYQFRYIDSTRALTPLYSLNGIDWITLDSTDTLTNDPISWGYFVRDGGLCRVHWVRLRTDAAGTTAPYPAGE